MFVADTNPAVWASISRRDTIAAVILVGFINNTTLFWKCVIKEVFQT